MKLFTPESWELLSSSIEKTRQTGVPYELELETVRNDGSRGWMWVRGEAVRDSAGNTVELWGAAQDITQRKKAEETIRRQLRDAVCMLDSMGRIYQKLLVSEDYDELSVREYMEDLVKSILEICPEKDSFTVNFDIEDLTLDVKTLFHLGIIVNELITNSLKYAFHKQDTGTIRIAVTHGNGKITLIVRDNGSGIPPGFSPDQSEGFGLMLVKLLVNQFDGSFTIENDQGTKSTVMFEV